MLGMKIMLPIILVVGGAGFAYHKVVVNEKTNRITQQQMDIAACTCLLYTSPSPRDS